MARGNGGGRRAGGRARSDAEEALEDSLSHGQTYVRDIQKILVPRVIVNSGYRWHNAANCNEMIQILSVRTALHRRQFFSNSFIPVWSTSWGMGGVLPSHITLCYLIFVES